MREGEGTKIDFYFQVKKEKEVKIVDFLMQDHSILVLVERDKGEMSRNENRYFSEVLRKVSAKWFPNRHSKLKTIVLKEERMKTPNLSPKLAKQGEDYIDRLINEKQSKEEYFVSIKNQEKIFSHIMNDYEPSRLLKIKLAQELQKS